MLVLPVTPEFTASFVAAAEAVFTSHARELPVQSTISIRQLRAALNGRVITPGDTGYDHARTVF